MIDLDHGFAQRRCGCGAFGVRQRLAGAPCVRTKARLAGSSGYAIFLGLREQSGRAAVPLAVERIVHILQLCNNMRASFVESVLKVLFTSGTLQASDSILTVCAGASERDLFCKLGLSNTLITNIDERMRADEFRPLAWSREDAQHLSFADESFDVAFVADGLHHCRSPHRALTEMYRVARKAVIVIESRDSAVMRLANRVGLSPRYELESVIDHNFAYEGVDNTPIPNYIYRWTESEFKKVIRSFNPAGRHDFQFFYALNLPYEMAKLRKSRAKLLILYAVAPLAKLFSLFFKRQCNSFAMVAIKPDIPADLWPWLMGAPGAVTFNRSYAAKHFKT